MPEKKRRNPFEDHIESDLFDVSELGAQEPQFEGKARVQHFFSTLPQSDEPGNYDFDLTEYDAQLYDYMTREIINQVMRPRHGDAVAQYSDEELYDLLHTPIIIAMMSGRHFPPLWRPQFPSAMGAFDDDDDDDDLDDFYLKVDEINKRYLADLQRPFRPVTFPSHSESRLTRYMGNKPSPRQQHSSNNPEWAQILGQAVRDVQRWLRRIFKRR